MNRIVYVLNGPNLNLLGQTPTPHLRSRNSCRCRGRLRQVAESFGLDLSFTFEPWYKKKDHRLDFTRQGKLHLASLSIPAAFPIRRFAIPTR